MVSKEYCLIQVPNCPVPSTEMSRTEYRDVQVSTEMSSYRDVQVLRCLGFSQAWHRHLFLSMAWEDRLPMHKLSIFPWIETSACGEGCFVWNGNSVSKFHRKKFIHQCHLRPGIEIGKFKLVAQTRFFIKNVYMFKGILSTTIVFFSYPKLLSFSVLTFKKWRLNTELLANTLRNVFFFRFKKADHHYWKLINYALTWARPNLFLCQ